MRLLGRWATGTWRVLPIVAAVGCSGGEVHKTLDAETSEAIYEASAGLCSLKWRLSAQGAPPRYGLRETSHCAMRMGDVNPLRDKLLGAIRSDVPDLNQLESFYWGSVRREDAGVDVAGLLAAEAASSSLWDSARGVPRQGAARMNETVRDLLIAADAFREPASAFQRVGLSLQVAQVEMVIVRPSEKLLLPWDGLVELSLHPGSSSVGKP
jgi:hypothetical protein